MHVFPKYINVHHGMTIVSGAIVCLMSLIIRHIGITDYRKLERRILG
jgi:hypothetical protein